MDRRMHVSPPKGLVGEHGELDATIQSHSRSESLCLFLFGVPMGDKQVSKTLEWARHDTASQQR